MAASALPPKSPKSPASPKLGSAPSGSGPKSQHHNHTTSESSSTQLPYETLTPSQMEILREFRSELEEEGHLKPNETLGTDDETLIRFLKARKFNLLASKRMITQCLQWRHQFEGIGIDGLYQQIDPFDFPNRDQVFQYWPIYFHGIDKLGRPVSIQKFGSLDLTKLYSVIDKESHFKVLVANCEALTREILPACTHRKHMISLEKSPKSNQRPEPARPNPLSQPTSSCQISNAFCIIDLKGFTLTQFWQIKNVARTCFSISQDYYPETMGYLAIINAPKSFSTIFKAIAPWLSKETISKINILGEDYQSTLLEHIDDVNLPSYLGGKCDCNNQFTCSKNDENFDRSPWLKDRSWKNQSWKKFHPQYVQDQNSRPGAEATQTHPSTPVLSQNNSQQQQNEVTDGGVTSDGALIINNSPKVTIKT